MKLSALAARACTVLTMSLASIGVFAQEPTPIGLWKNIDDKTGKPRALIRVADSKGELSGRIEKLFQDAGEEADPKCDKCEGPQKGQPILGLTILSGFRLDGDGYVSGRVLDPANGQTYKSKLALMDGGKKLRVRGYIGVPWIGRSQIWLREE